MSEEIASGGVAFVGLEYLFGINNGPAAGQEVLHLRAHFMGGESMEMQR